MGVRACCDNFAEEARVGCVNGVKEKKERGILILRKWHTLKEFGEEKSVLCWIETTSDYNGLNLFALFKCLVFDE